MSEDNPFWLSTRANASLDPTFTPQDSRSAEVNATPRHADAHSSTAALPSTPHHLHRRTAEATVPTHPNLLATAIDCMAEGMLIADASRHVYAVNRTALELHGCASPSAFRTRFKAYADHYACQHSNGEALPRDVWPVHRALRGDTFSRLEVAVQCRHDGSTWVGSFNARPLDAADGFNPLTIITFRAISGPAPTENAEEVTSKHAGFTQQSWLATMSHEIRTPLTGIVGFAGILANEVDAPHRTFAQLIERSGRRLEHIVDAVLTLAKLESDQQSLEPESVCIAEEVELVFQLLEKEATAKNLCYNFHADPAAQNACAHVDRGAITAIAQNLISNAIKYTDEGEVTVTVRLSSTGEVEIEVADSGIGIDEAFLPHIFESFARESRGIDRGSDGSGLGLSITKAFVDRMGGTLRVDSEKGSGSRFRASFPTVHDSKRDADAPAPSNLPKRSNIQVLIAEDNTATQLLLRVLLDAYCDVTIVSSADAALDQITQRLDTYSQAPFDIVMVDICLDDGSSGNALVAQLRTIDELHDTPIVALTAHALPGDRAQFIESGFDAYLGKPFTPSELLSLVAEMTD